MMAQNAYLAHFASVVSVVLGVPRENGPDTASELTVSAELAVTVRVWVESMEVTNPVPAL